MLDTYAHHPTELAADLRAAREIAAGGRGGNGRVIAVFQPHLYSRTRIFAAEFGAALGLADEVVVLDVYAAREDPEPGVTGQAGRGRGARRPFSGQCITSRSSATCPRSSPRSPRLATWC